MTTVEDIIANDQKTVLMLGDIGVFGFRRSFELYPSRVYNIGILEQATISMAAGLNMTGLTPIVHTIATFITERCFEQIKDDFGYQKLNGNIVSVGGSYDYAALGCTHHAPDDVPILMNIPTVQVVVPGTAGDFDSLFRQSYSNRGLRYYRLSERENEFRVPVKFGKANVIKLGRKATVIAVGPLLDKALVAVKNLDVTVIYLTTVRPLDTKTITANLSSGKLLICEPYYSGSITQEIMSAFKGTLRIDHLGVPKKFLVNYGTAKDHDRHMGFTEKEINRRVKELIHE
ncbi:hypothetical protein M1345_03460 [Patescibacteria group bacterium]|nr:hypothetical protein [Patescibacteria group bacterium]